METQLATRFETGSIRLQEEEKKKRIFPLSSLEQNIFFKHGSDFLFCIQMIRRSCRMFAFFFFFMESDLNIYFCQKFKIGTCPFLCLQCCCCFCCCFCEQSEAAAHCRHVLTSNNLLLYFFPTSHKM